MDTKKFLFGTIAGGITLFLLGYLIYGLALNSFFKQHTLSPAGAMKEMSEIVWWALILGNLAGGALLTYILLKTGKFHSFGSGASTGAAIGFYMGLSIDLVRFATENAFDSTALMADVAVAVVMNAIAGGVIGIVLGAGKKAA